MAFSQGARIVGIGEILLDRFDTGQVALGGAPFNVIFHLHQLLRSISRGEAVFVNAVGSDNAGSQILREVADAGMDTRHLQVLDGRVTGAANVFVTGGHAGFEIVPDVAWDYLASSADLDALARNANAVVFGTLAQRNAVSRETIQGFISHVQGHRLCDVNLRRNTTDGVAGYTPEIIDQSLALATMVKMNDEELDEIAAILELRSESDDPDVRRLHWMRQLRDRYSLQLIAVTRASRGSILINAHQCLQLGDSTIHEELVHPVGAGDAFVAGLLAGVLEHWRPENCLELANILSSWVALHTSATPRLSASVLTEISSLVRRATTRNTGNSASRAIGMPE